MNKSPIQILRDAKELLSDRYRWTQGSLARNADGDETVEFDKGAVCWCSAGAIFKVDDCEDGISAEADQALRLLERTVYGEFVSRGVGPWNDNAHTTHEDVLKAFDKAIELATTDLETS